MIKEHCYDYYKDYRESEKHVANLQLMLEHTYNSRQFWLKMFWLQVALNYAIILLKQEKDDEDQES